MNKTCPFCGSDKIEQDHSILPIMGIDTFWIKCKNCGAYGPSAITEKMARKLWNEREDANDDGKS